MQVPASLHTSLLWQKSGSLGGLVFIKFLVFIRVLEDIIWNFCSIRTFWNYFKSNPGATGTEGDCAKGISSLLPNWKGIQFFLRMFFFLMQQCYHIGTTYFDTPGNIFKCRCTISWTTHILPSCITPGQWTWTQRCNINSTSCISYPPGNLPKDVECYICVWIINMILSRGQIHK